MPREGAERHGVVDRPLGGALHDGAVGAGPGIRMSRPSAPGKVAATTFLPASRSAIQIGSAVTSGLSAGPSIAVAAHRRREAADVGGEGAGAEVVGVGDDVVVGGRRPGGDGDVPRRGQRGADRHVLLGVDPDPLQQAEPLVRAERARREVLVDEPRRRAVQGDDDDLGRGQRGVAKKSAASRAPASTAPGE